MDFDPFELDFVSHDSTDIWQHRMLQFQCTKMKMTDVRWNVIIGYILFGVLILCSIISWATSKREKQDRVMTVVFLLLSLSLGFLPAIGTQTLTPDTKAALNFRRWLLYPAMSLSSMMFNYVGIRSTTGRLCARDTWAVLHILLMILIVAAASYDLAALVSFVVFSTMLLIYIWQAISKNYFVAVKLIGLATVYSSFIITLVLRNRCGAEGVKTCFSECPLPQPLSFTYLNLVQVIAIGGLIIMGIGEALVPSSSLYLPLLLPGGTRQDAIVNNQSSRVLAAMLPQDDNENATSTLANAVAGDQANKKEPSEQKEENFNDDEEKGASK